MTNKIRQTRQITIETHSITIIRAKGNSLADFCERCQHNVAAFAPEQIARFFQLTMEEVCRRVEQGELHLTKMQRGVALICGDSLNHTEFENFGTQNK